MAAYNVKFTWTYATAAGDTTDHVLLTVLNAAGTQIGQQGVAKATGQTSVTLAIPAGGNHVATLTAYNIAGIADLNPPSQTFSVADVATPGDPVFNAPVQVS